MINLKISAGALTYLHSAIDQLDMIDSPFMPEAMKQKIIADIVSSRYRSECLEAMQAALDEEKTRQETLAGMVAE